MKTTTIYGFDTGAITHIKVIEHPHIGYRLSDTISKCGRYMAHITSYGKGIGP